MRDKACDWRSVTRGDLTRAVGAKVGKLAGLADFGQTTSQFVGQRDWRGHQLGRLVRRIAEHHALVACSPGVHSPLAMSPDCLLIVEITAQVFGVESVDSVVVADGRDDTTDQRLEVDIRARSNLAGNDDEARRSEGLAGHAAVGVLFKAGIEDGVGNLVGDFVGMAFGTDSEVKRNFSGAGKEFPPRDADCHARWGGRIRWDYWLYGTRGGRPGQRVPAEGEPGQPNSEMRGLERTATAAGSAGVTLASRDSTPHGVESGCESYERKNSAESEEPCAD